MRTLLVHFVYCLLQSNNFQRRIVNTFVKKKNLNDLHHKVPTLIFLQPKTHVNVQKKHIKNAAKLEELRAQQALNFHINSWLLPSEATIDYNTMSAMFDCIKRIISAMGYEYDRSFLLSIVIYAERFVKTKGLITLSESLRTLVVSTVVTTKMWYDTGTTFKKQHFLIK
jgi:hypothetical protein